MQCINAITPHSSSMLLIVCPHPQHAVDPRPLPPRGDALENLTTLCLLPHGGHAMVGGHQSSILEFDLETQQQTNQVSLIPGVRAAIPTLMTQQQTNQIYPLRQAMVHLMCILGKFVLDTSTAKVKVFYGQELPNGEFITTECGVNYQLLAVMY